MINPKTNIPRWSLRMLRWVLRKEYLEEIEGDLEENFEDNLATSTIRKAQRKYLWEVITLIRPSLIKRPRAIQKLNQYGMFKNYFVTSLRSMRKNTLFSGINVLGLAISMSVGILMIVLLSELNSFDDFHIKKDQIHRVTSAQVQGLKGLEIKQATASYYVGQEIENQIPGVEEVLIMSSGHITADLKIGEDGIPIRGFFAGPAFFEIFTFELLHGNPQTMLSTPNGIVITESTAKTLFDNADPMGKLLMVENNVDLESVIVTGVVKDPPMNSHLQFEVLISLSTLDGRITDEPTNFKTDPGQTDVFSVYLLLNENASPDDVEYSLTSLIQDYNETLEHPIKHSLQPMSTFVTGETYWSNVGPTFSQGKINIMIGLTLIVLLSAAFNYTNLSLARALRRSKEVGIRKVTGATQTQVFLQFWVQAVMIAFIALLGGIGLFLLIKPAFLNLPNPYALGYPMFTLDISTTHLSWFFLFALMVGSIAGVLPALFLSKLRASTVFNDASKIKVFSGLSLRRVLVVFQFTLSIGLIMAAVLVHQQYKYVLDYNMGFTTENIVNVNVQGNYSEILEAEYSKIPQVIETSKSSWVLGVGGGSGLSGGMFKSDGQERPAVSWVNYVDIDYLEMHDIELIAGAQFQRELGQNEIAKEIIVDTGFLNSLSLGSPEEAVGKTVSFKGEQVTIIGVAETSVSVSLTKNIFQSLVYAQTVDSEQYKTLNLKVSPENLFETMDKLESIYESIDPVHPFQASFYQDEIIQTYSSKKADYSIISFLALLAVSISTLGLMGMAVFTTESRMKEISIRKVLGARIQHLALLLSKNFIGMILIAGVIAIPLTLYIVDQEILNDYWQRVSIGTVEMLSGLIIVVLIAMLTVGWQIKNAASQNPADLLRNE